MHTYVNQATDQTITFLDILIRFLLSFDNPSNISLIGKVLKVHIFTNLKYKLIKSEYLSLPWIKQVNGLLIPGRYIEQVTSPDILPPDFKYPYLYVPTHLCSRALCSQLLFPITLMYPHLYIS